MPPKWVATEVPEPPTTADIKFMKIINMTNVRTVIGNGKGIMKICRSGSIIANAISTPNTAPLAPTIGIS